VEENVMPGAAKMLLFVLLLPFFAALGHDVYINYFSDDDKIKEFKKLQIDPEDFKISDLGWVWQHYSPDTLETAKDTVGADEWKEKYDPILQKPTMVVGLVPAAIGAGYLLIAFVLGIWPFIRFAKQRQEDSANYGVYKKAKTNAMKFTKK